MRTVDWGLRTGDSAAKKRVQDLCAAVRQAASVCFATHSQSATLAYGQ